MVDDKGRQTFQENKWNRLFRIKMEEAGSWLWN